MFAPPPDDDRVQIVDLLQQLISGQQAATPAEAMRLQRFFALHVLPTQPTMRVRQKHAQHVEDDSQWPTDVSADDYLESLREAILDPRASIFLAEPGLEGSWTLYFVGTVRYHSRGRHSGGRIVVLFNAERLFWITGFQAESGDEYVERRPGFWVHHSR